MWFVQLYYGCKEEPGLYYLSRIFSLKPEFYIYTGCKKVTYDRLLKQQQHDKKFCYVQKISTFVYWFP